MVKALRSCRSRQRENQGRSLAPQKKPQENSYTIFYSLKYIPYRMPQSRQKQRLEGYIIPLSSVLGPIPQGMHKRFHKRCATGSLGFCFAAAAVALISLTWR